MDPLYKHEFDPNKKGLCKTRVGGSICHLPEDALVHARWRAYYLFDKRDEYLAEIARLRGALREIKKIATMNLSHAGGHVEMTKLTGAFRSLLFHESTAEHFKKLEAILCVDEDSWGTHFDVTRDKIIKTFFGLQAAIREYDREF